MPYPESVFKENMDNPSQSPKGDPAPHAPPLDEDLDINEASQDSNHSNVSKDSNASNKSGSSEESSSSSECTIPLTLEDFLDPDVFRNINWPLLSGAQELQRPPWLNWQKQVFDDVRLWLNW